jgi:fluoride exporter
MWRPPRRELTVVAAGGALGAASRYGLGLILPDPVGAGFPWTTFAINVAGCLAIGVLAAAMPRHRLLRPFLGAGFLGGFTTMSTYADQARALLVAGHWAVALSYVVATLVAALLAVRIGLAVVRR